MRTITYAEAIREAMSEKMRADDRVFLMGEDVGIYGGAFGVSVGMIEEFGADRVRDTPISEAAIVGAGTGAALVEMRPIVEIQFSDFLMIAMDQLANQAAKIRYMFGGSAQVPLVVRAPGGSGTGAAAQHSQSLEAMFCHVPGLKVVIPSTPYDAKGLLRSAIDDNNPVVFLEQKMLYRNKGEVPEEPYDIPLGSCDVKRTGDDLTIVSWGRMIPVCLEAAETLAGEHNISPDVIDVRTLAPLDTTTIIQSVKKTGRALVVHEAVQTGGFGGEIVARIAASEAFYCLDAPVQRLGGLDVPIPYSPELERDVVPTVPRVIQACRNLME